MVNRLLHKVETVSRESVDTVDQLTQAIRDMSNGGDDLDTTYVVELLGETLSDGSVAYSVRIREAERA